MKLWNWTRSKNKKNIDELKIRNICYTLFDGLANQFGMTLLMNGDWFDCNHCGVIIHKSKAQESDIGMICLGCKKLFIDKSFGELKELLNKQ